MCLFHLFGVVVFCLDVCHVSGNVLLCVDVFLWLVVALCFVLSRAFSVLFVSVVLCCLFVSCVVILLNV